MYRFLIFFAFWPVFGLDGIRKEDHEGETDTKYKFEYSVKDTETGNIHSRKEKWHQGTLSGQYSSHFPDGFKRTVVYEVNGDSGFVATIYKERIYNCHQCPEAAPYSVSYEIHHGSPDHHVRSFFYLTNGGAVPMEPGIAQKRSTHFN